MCRTPMCEKEENVTAALKIFKKCCGSKKYQNQEGKNL